MYQHIVQSYTFRENIQEIIVLSTVACLLIKLIEATFILIKLIIINNV